MILEMIFAPIKFLILIILNVIPELPKLPEWVVDFVDLFQTGISLLPGGVVSIVFINIVFWLSVHLAWSVVEWVYKKIPGVS